MSIMRKHLLTTLLLTITVLGLSAQELSPDVQAVYNACQQIQLAIGAGSTASLREASQTLKDCDVHYFNSLYIEDEDLLPSIKGHFVFDYEFIDSLIVNRAVYEFAERYAQRSSMRSTSSVQDAVHTRTCTVRANSSMKFTIAPRGHQELAFVTEPGGRITVRIHDVSHDQWYNDYTKENKGLPSRVQIFDLPTNERSSVEVEVINKAYVDISFVVISN